jgi:hypothetical protein
VYRIAQYLDEFSLVGDDDSSGMGVPKGEKCAWAGLKKKKREMDSVQCTEGGHSHTIQQNRPLAREEPIFSSLGARLHASDDYYEFFFFFILGCSPG